jgi:hypothetical protein
MSLEWIRDYYGVPAYRLRPITFEDKPGKITGSSGPYLVARVEGYNGPIYLHPTWHVEYPEATS